MADGNHCHSRRALRLAALDHSSSQIFILSPVELVQAGRRSPISNRSMSAGSESLSLYQSVACQQLLSGISAMDEGWKGTHPPLANWGRRPSLLSVVTHRAERSDQASFKTRWVSDVGGRPAKDSSLSPKL